MYKSIRRRVSQTKNGTYRRNDWFLDFEKLPWMEWMDMQPMRKGQRVSLHLLYPILLQEINIAKPSKLLHFLIGKGILHWQDVVVIQHNRQTDLEMNPAFLRIIMTRGQEGFYAFIDALRSRHGAWQGYLADMIEMQFNPAIVRDLLDIFKIVCHDLTKIMPAGWSALPRILGLPVDKIETCGRSPLGLVLLRSRPMHESANSTLAKARRQNRLLVNQALHSLLLWSGHRDDKEGVLNDLLVGLMNINRTEIAESVVRLVDMVHRLQGWRMPNGPKSSDSNSVFPEDNARETDAGIDFDTGLSLPTDEDIEIAAVFSRSPRRKSRSKGSRRGTLPSGDSGIASPTPPPGSPRRASATPGKNAGRFRSRSQQSITPRGRIDSRMSTRLRSLTPLSATDAESIMQTGKVYSYGLSPRRKSSAWEGRTPTILQRDYSVHPNRDNLFMDYLVYQ